MMKMEGYIPLNLTPNKPFMKFYKGIKKQCGLLFMLMALSFFAHAQLPAYKNNNLSPEIRAKNLLNKMTVDEKLIQLQCLWLQKTRILDADGNFDESKAA